MFPEPDKLYFPPAGFNWKTVNPLAVEWDAKKLELLLDFAGEQNELGREGENLVKPADKKNPV